MNFLSQCLVSSTADFHVFNTRSCCKCLACFEEVHAREWVSEIKHICIQVAKLQSERELLKRAYGEEKKKADRCDTALNNGQS